MIKKKLNYLKSRKTTYRSQKYQNLQKKKNSYLFYQFYQKEGYQIAESDIACGVCSSMANMRLLTKREQFQIQTCPQFLIIPQIVYKKIFQCFFETVYTQNSTTKNQNYNYFLFCIMLSTINSMCQAELEMLNQFLSGLQVVKNVITSHLSKQFNTPNVAINLSPLLNIHIFCPLDEKDKNQISIQDFLNKCIDRWRQEIQYQEDILNLKDQIINEFNILCHDVKDENLIQTVKKQRDQVVETLFAKTNFDMKNQAGEFCKSFMNGFEIEIIEKINYYATYVVWMPFITQLPEGLFEFVKKILHEEVSDAINEINITSASAKIIQYTEDQLKRKKIHIQSGLFGMIKKFAESRSLKKEKNVIRISQLADVLKAAHVNRKACKLSINEVGKNDNIIFRERTKIEIISVKMKAKNFLETNIPYTYEYLKLEDVKDEKNWEQFKQILLKLPKCLVSASLEFKNNIQNGIRIIKNNETHVYELHFAQCGPLHNQMRLLPELRNHLQFPLQFIIPHFQHNAGFLNAATDEEITTLSNVFTQVKTFQHLNLNFEGALITANAIDSFVTSIGQMNQMKYLHLNFSNGKNSVNNNSMKLLAQAISEMPNLNHFGLNFGGGNNQITDDGIIQLSQAIQKSSNIQQLILWFLWGKNCVTDKGLEELSRSITYLKNIQQLSLNFGGGNNGISDKGLDEFSLAIANLTGLKHLCLAFFIGNHQISDKGMQALAAALKNILNLNTLYLDIRNGKNSISGIGIRFLAEAIASLESPLDFTCYFIGHPNTVTEADIEHLRIARKYKNFTTTYEWQIKKDWLKRICLTQKYFQ